MRITYISNSRLPTEKAYGVSIVKTCEALADMGAQLTVYAPRIKNASGEDIFSYYGIRKNFSVRYIPTLDAVTWGVRYGFLLNQVSFALAVFFLHRGDKRADVVITRDEISGWLLGLKGYRVLYDMHGFPERHLWLWKIALKKMSGIFATNQWKITQCHTLFGIPLSKMVVARNGFDPDEFAADTSMGTVRKELSLPVGKQIVLYTGHLYDWKGVHVLAEVARVMPSTYFVFVGGTPYHQRAFKERHRDIANILLVGHRRHKDIPLFLRAADVLVLPNSAHAGDNPRSTYSRNDTSPIKLFEYMASGRPIVASSLPSIREILNEQNAFLVQPDNPEDLKRGIEKALGDTATARQRAARAREDVRVYTWEKRASSMLRFITKFAG